MVWKEIKGLYKWNNVSVEFLDQLNVLLGYIVSWLRGNKNENIVMRIVEMMWAIEIWWPSSFFVRGCISLTWLQQFHFFTFSLQAISWLLFASNTVGDNVQYIFSHLDLNEILSDLLMEACISSSLMPEGLLREHTMLIAVLNSRVGSEIGKYCINFAFVFSP